MVRAVSISPVTLPMLHSILFTIRYTLAVAVSVVESALPSLYLEKITVRVSMCCPELRLGFGMIVQLESKAPGAMMVSPRVSTYSALPELSVSDLRRKEWEELKLRR